MKTDDLLNLYRLYFEQENFFVKNYEDRTVFYMGIVTLLLTGIASGLFFAKEWFHYLLLVFGSVMLISIAIFAKDAIFRSYRRGLEMITMKTKIEIALGLTEQFNKNEKTTHPWKNEPIIPNRYLKDHKKFETSEQFIDFLAKKNYSKTLIRVFNYVIFIGIGLLILLIGLSIVNFL